MDHIIVTRRNGNISEEDIDSFIEASECNGQEVDFDEAQFILVKIVHSEIVYLILGIFEFILLVATLFYIFFKIYRGVRITPFKTVLYALFILAQLSLILFCVLFGDWMYYDCARSLQIWTNSSSLLNAILQTFICF